ncbi:MAG: hypothetical protein ACFCGT_05835 [Sandaracinaceae bacterium]
MVLGLVAPFLVAGPEEWRAAGLRFDRPLRHLAVGTVLGALLLVQFITEADTTPRPVAPDAAWTAEA